METFLATVTLLGACLFFVGVFEDHKFNTKTNRFEQSIKDLNSKDI